VFGDGDGFALGDPFEEPTEMSLGVEQADAIGCRGVHDSTSLNQLKQEGQGD
jgi:hypothetical protein